MPPHFFESKLFSVAMLIGTLAPMAATAFLLYPKYQTEAALESYAPTSNTLKVSEEVSVKHRSNKSSSWREYIPCITLTLSDASAPITACKVAGFVDSPEQARQFLSTNYGSASGFTVYVSPDRTKASLESYSPDRARSALLLLVLILTIVPVFNIGIWFFLRSMVKKAKLGVEK